MTVLENILEHHGVKGMHWGVRRGRNAGTSVVKTTHATLKEVHAKRAAKAAVASATGKAHHSPDALTYHQLRAKSHKGVHALTNDEIQALTKRFDLEQKYSKMVESQSAGRKKHPATKVAKRLINKAADTTINEIGGALGKKAATRILPAALKTP